MQFSANYSICKNKNNGVLTVTAMTDVNTDYLNNDATMVMMKRRRQRHDDEDVDLEMVLKLTATTTMATLW